MTISLSAIFKKKTNKTLNEYKQEILVKQGREQFKKMLDKGLELPVVLL